MSLKTIPYGHQTIDARDVHAVVKVLRADRITQGPMVARFEEAFAKYCGAPYAVAVSSGTAALHLAALAAGFGDGDDVITTPLTFVATVNAAIYVGATPRFCDIDGRSLCLDPFEVNKHISGRTTGIISVDFAGMPALIHRRPRITVIEDACHALGASYRSNGHWRKIGCCELSDLTVFSLHPVKHITTGEGGLITTRRKDLYEKILLLRNHGIESRSERFVRKRNGGNPWYYEINHLGFNYRLSDFQCALGLSQLKKIDGFVSKRQDIARQYDRSFRDMPGIHTPSIIEGRLSSYHLYVLRIDFGRLGLSRKDVMERLRRKGIMTQVHYIPVFHHPYYARRFRYSLRAFPVCESYYRMALSIPIFPGMSASDVKRVIDAVHGLYVKGKES